MGVLELANRLCLHRLTTLVEAEVVAQMGAVVDGGGEVTEEALRILEKCQVSCNAILLANHSTKENCAPIPNLQLLSFTTT